MFDNNRSTLSTYCTAKCILVRHVLTMNVFFVISQKLKAVEFAEDGSGGLVVKLGQSQSKSARKVKKFECELFSCFPEEKETLFFGGETELRIKGIMQWAQGRWRHYDKFMEPINALNLMIKGKPLQNQSIWSNEKTQRWMNGILRDHLHQQLSQTDKMESPQYVSSLVSYQMSSKEHVQLNWNEMKSGYQWMSCIVKSDDNQLDIANLSVLFADSSSITFMAPDGVDLDEEEWESVVIGLSKVHEMGLSMKIRFQLLSDESQQNEMYMMAEGYLEMEESKWQCRHDGNMLTFSISEDAESEKESVFFRQRAESMIAGLDSIIRPFDERLEKERQRKLAEQRRIKRERELAKQMLEKQRRLQREREFKSQQDVNEAKVWA